MLNLTDWRQELEREIFLTRTPEAYAKLVFEDKVQLDIEIEGNCFLNFIPKDSKLDDGDTFYEVQLTTPHFILYIGYIRVNWADRYTCKPEEEYHGGC